MLTFLLIAGTGSVLVALAMVLPLMAGRGSAAGRDATDARVFRDQLDEIERDLARGTITEGEAEGARAEVSRRLIAAAGRAETAQALGPAPRGLSRLAAGIAVVVTLGVTGVVYGQLGTPAMPDRPLSARSALDPAIDPPGRPSQVDAEAMAAASLPPPVDDPRFEALLARLHEVLAERPDDVEGHRILARSLAQAGRWVEARRASDRLIDLLGNAAGARDHADHAEAMIFAAGGYVSPVAAQALARALKIDPADPMARYYAAFALRQTGRPEAAAEVWRTLLGEDVAAAEPRGEAWRDALRALIAETDPGAAVTPDAGAGAGTALPGPSREDVEAAGQLSAEERAARINAMVARLDTRLAEEGGSAEEWVRLINAYVQLGRMDDARRVLGRSQTSLEGTGGAGFVRERALLLGVEVE